MRVLQKISILTVALMLAIFIAAPAMAATIAVTPTGPGVIAAAVAAASPTDTITVAAGFYSEPSLNISKADLSIVGEGSGLVIIDAVTAGGQNGIYITASNVTLQGLTVNGNVAHYTVWPPAKPWYGIYFSAPGNGALKDVVVTSFGKSGINLTHIDGVTLTNVTSINNGGAGIFMAEARNISLQNIVTDNNQWTGVAVNTINGKYGSPTGTDGIVFSGMNYFGESHSVQGGIMIEEEYYNGGPIGITYSVDGAAANVKMQSSDVAFALHGNQEEANGTNRIRFYMSLSDAVNAKAAPFEPILNISGPGHFLDAGRTIESLDAGDAFVNSLITAMGPSVPTGPQGNPGYTPVKGTDYFDGENGTNGESVTGTPELAGANCAAGGVKYTSVSGVDYVCNGAQGSSGTSSWTDGTGMVTTVEKVGMGTSNPLSALHIAEQNGTNNNRGIISSQHYNGPTAAILQYKRSRGTLTTPLALMNGDAIGAFHFQVYDGSNYQNVSSIRSMVNGTVSSGSVPGELWFHTGVNGADTMSSPRMIISSSGNVGIGTNAPTQKLDVNGNVKATAFYGDGTNLTGIIGTSGADGNDGLDGTDGISVTATPEPAGTNCPAGGVKYTSASGDDYVCNGAQGSPGSSSWNDGTGVVTTDVNVGIGISDPVQKLEVNGSVSFGGGSANHAICWKADGKTLGYCSDAVASDGSCTCN